MPDPNGVDIALMYVGHDGIQPQGPDEPNFAFRSRVAQVMRSKGKIVDAHEIQTNRFHDENLKEDGGGDVRKGCMGAAALALSGHGKIDSTVIDRTAYDVMKKREEERNNPDYADALLMLVSALGGR